MFRSLILLTVLGICQPARMLDAPVVNLTEWRVAKAGIRTDSRGVVLRVSKGSGWISTNIEYLDFVLRLRFRPVTPDAEGAVLLRAWQRVPGDWPMTGYRVAIGAPTQHRVDLVTGFSEKTKVVSGPPENSMPAFAVAEWRHLEITCRWDQITVVVDGRKIAVVEGREPQAGTIGIEAREGMIEYADITLTPIDTAKPPGPPPRAAIRLADPQRVPSGLTNPVRVREVKPRYTPGAMAADIQGNVVVEAVIGIDGSVEETQVIRSLHCDLDAEAVAAARRWQFTPGLRDGIPIPVLVTIELTFTLRR